LNSYSWTGADENTHLPREKELTSKLEDLKALITNVQNNTAKMKKANNTSSKDQELLKRLNHRLLGSQ